MLGNLIRHVSSIILIVAIGSIAVRMRIAVVSGANKVSQLLTIYER